MLSEWELWAVAAKVLEQHKGEAPVFVASRLGALALAGDEDGIATWQAVARRIVSLSEAPPTVPHS